jgi:hypothetical protein
MMGQQKHELDVAFAAIVKRIGALFARNYAGGGRPEWPEIGPPVSHQRVS